MLGIINYGSGNFSSLCNAIEYLKIPYREVNSPTQLADCSHLILPGVGAFHDCMRALQALELVDPLKNVLQSTNTFFLGICVGHQILSSIGNEFGRGEGLGIIPGETKKFEGLKNLPVPHMGWNEVKFTHDDPIFDGILEGSTFYFVHSYYIQLEDPKFRLASTDYGKSFVSAVKRNNIYGVQFHPEKSQSNGLRLLKNFADLE